MSRGLPTSDQISLYCIELRSTEWAASVEWYRNVLGLRVLIRAVDDGYALIEAGGVRLALLARQDAGEPSRQVSLAFEVANLPFLRDRLERLGVPFSIPEGHPEGLREINLADPDGNRLRLFCWPEGH